MDTSLKFWHHHGGVSVPDLDAAIAGWHQVLDFDVEFVQEPKPTQDCANLSGA